MSRCVPSWDVEDHNSKNTDQTLKASLGITMSSNNHDVPALDYEVAELTWKNGQVAMHGLGPPRMVTKYAWDKPRAAETLETIVNQATHQPNCKPHNEFYAQELVPWLDHHGSAVAAGSVSASATVTMDALVPTSGTQQHTLTPGAHGGRTACSPRVGSCSSDQSGFGDHMVAHGGGGGGGGGGVMVAAAHEWSSCRDQSVSESSRQLTVETSKREVGVKGFTSPSMGSPEDTISGERSMKSTSPDEHDSVCHMSRCQIDPGEKKKGRGKSSISTKRSRAAAIHNQSERTTRQDQSENEDTTKLVPNANKTDKASMLDEVIEYLKQLQAQVHMIGRMSMSPMMMPLAMQQQLQMAMMNPMGMGMGIGMGMGMGIGMPGVMDLNTIGRPSIPGMPPVFHPSTFMQPQPMMASWDTQTTGDHRVANHSEPMAAFLACQSQPMTMEGYGRMAALFQQMQNQHCYSGLKN